MSLKCLRRPPVPVRTGNDAATLTAAGTWIGGRLINPYPVLFFTCATGCFLFHIAHLAFTETIRKADVEHAGIPRFLEAGVHVTVFNGGAGTLRVEDIANGYTQCALVLEHLLTEPGSNHAHGLQLDNAFNTRTAVIATQFSAERFRQ